MATERTVTAKGAAKRMTLGELRQFIDALDHAGTWGGGLQQIQATAVRFGDEAL